MKKYCLTDCAKRKLSTVKKGIIEIVVLVLFVFGMVLTLAVVSVIIGFIGQGLWVTFLGPLVALPTASLIELGSGILLLSVLGLAVGVLIYKILAYIYIGLRTVITNTVIKRNGWGEETVCHIFEECKEEVDDEA